MPGVPSTDNSTPTETPTPSKSTPAPTETPTPSKSTPAPTLEEKMVDETTPIAQAAADKASGATKTVVGVTVGAGERALQAVGTGAERVGDVVQGKWERALARVRPWGEFIDVGKFGGFDEGVKEVPARVVKNIKYFRFNYMVVWMVIVALSVLTRPWSLLGCLGMVGLWVVLFGVYTGENSRIGDVVVSDEAKIGVLCLVGVVVFAFAHAEKMFLSGAVVTTVIAFAHALARKPVTIQDEENPVVV
eukprot:Plantae.Rhodophyta-Hildenbrandia_rubra.ctg24209.p1 GENE.Plantae.Rhodophyta-Hildenbrandia_rubra.ctg24209~~Plantae.Rhodophyta-Hildenbrandia_rubra.ctg24209.p1  ORF type:complete len:247 (-),score=64.56 Plantae.Rhodophyta-Hildenbrandia_rubra.ctg24209:2211-2951(-)